MRFLEISFDFCHLAPNTSSRLAGKPSTFRIHDFSVNGSEHLSISGMPWGDLLRNTGLVILAGARKNHVKNLFESWTTLTRVGFFYYLNFKVFFLAYEENVKLDGLTVII